MKKAFDWYMRGHRAADRGAHVDQRAAARGRSRSACCIFGLHLNRVPVDVQSFIEWNGKATAPETWTAGDAPLHDAPPLLEQPAHAARAGARSRRGSASGRRRRTTPRKYFDREHYIDLAKKEIDPEQLKTRTDMLFALLEWGVIEANAAHGDADTTHKDRAESIYATIGSSVNKDSKVWWLSKYQWMALPGRHRRVREGGPRAPLDGTQLDQLRRRQVRPRAEVQEAAHRPRREAAQPAAQAQVTAATSPTPSRRTPTPMLMRILAAALLAAAPGATGGDDDTIVMRDGTTRSGKVQAAEAAGCSLAVGKKTDTIAWTSISTVQYGGAKDFDSARQLLAEGKVPEGSPASRSSPPTRRCARRCARTSSSSWRAPYRRRATTTRRSRRGATSPRATPTARYLVSGGAWLVSALIARNDPGGALRAVDELTSDARGANADAAQVAALDLLRGRALEGQKKFPDAQSAYERVAAVKEMPADYAAAAQLGVSARAPGRGQEGRRGQALPRPAREASAAARLGRRVERDRRRATSTARVAKKDVDALSRRGCSPTSTSSSSTRRRPPSRPRSSSARWSGSLRCTQALADLENTARERKGRPGRTRPEAAGRTEAAVPEGEVNARGRAGPPIRNPAEDRQEPSMAICENCGKKYTPTASTPDCPNCAQPEEIVPSRAKARPARAARRAPAPAPRAPQPQPQPQGRAASKAAAKQAAAAHAAHHAHLHHPELLQEADGRADRQDRLRDRGRPLMVLVLVVFIVVSGKKSAGGHRPRGPEAGAARVHRLHPRPHREQRGERGAKEAEEIINWADSHKEDLGARRGTRSETQGAITKSRAPRAEPAAGRTWRTSSRASRPGLKNAAGLNVENVHDMQTKLSELSQMDMGTEAFKKRVKDAGRLAVRAPLRDQAARRVDRLRHQQREPAAPRAQPLLPGGGRAEEDARDGVQGRAGHQEPGRPQVPRAALQGGRRVGRPHRGPALQLSEAIDAASVTDLLVPPQATQWNPKKFQALNGGIELDGGEAGGKKATIVSILDFEPPRNFVHRPASSRSTAATVIMYFHLGRPRPRRRRASGSRVGGPVART